MKRCPALPPSLVGGAGGNHSQADADPMVAACLDSGTITALALAFDCADQGSGFAEDLRARLEQLLTDVSDPATSPERRHLITAVLLDLPRASCGVAAARSRRVGGGGQADGEGAARRSSSGRRPVPEHCLAQGFCFGVRGD